jgi:hypothetical protein
MDADISVLRCCSSYQYKIHEIVEHQIHGKFFLVSRTRNDEIIIAWSMSLVKIGTSFRRRDFLRRIAKKCYLTPRTIGVGISPKGIDRKINRFLPTETNLSVNQDLIDPLCFKPDQFILLFQSRAILNIISNIKTTHFRSSILANGEGQNLRIT